MSVNVKIKNEKKLFSKKIEVENLLLKDMRFGISNHDYLIEENKIGEHTIIFNSNHIARGFELSINDSEINVKMSLPTSEEEINYFYEYIRYLCEQFKTEKFQRDDEILSIEDIQNCIEMDIEASRRALKEMNKNIEEKKYECLYIFGAFNPIALGKKELTKIGDSPKKFGEYMNHIQNIDAYYATPNVYQKENSTLFGVYTLTENVLSVVPFKAKLFMPEKDIEISDWYAGFVIEGKVAGFIPYQKFIDAVDKNQEYDAEHFLITLNKKTMQKLIEQHKVEFK